MQSNVAEAISYDAPGTFDGRADKPLRVLIVEDESIIASDLAQTLTSFGYAVVGIASSSQEAIELARRTQPGLVLMDIRLNGDVDGIATAALLRARRSVPIVFLSANADAITLRRALHTAPCGFLAKPYNDASLRATIEVALQRHHTEIALRTGSIEIEIANQDLTSQYLELECEAERYRKESILDPLTQLYNRRYLDTVIKRELNLAGRENLSLGVILLDLDHFKQINDRHGHAQGDAVLRKVADRLRARLRDYDVPCRFGGEEFAVVLPGISLDDATQLAENIRAEIESLTFACAGGESIGVTASLGVAAAPPDRGLDATSLLGAADKALYRAKRAGRNCVATTPA